MTDRPLTPACQFDYDEGWVVIRPRDKGKSAHVIPASDMRAHECSGDCWCRPRTADEDDNVVVHNSMDGREQYENGRKPH